MTSAAKELGSDARTRRWALAGLVALLALAWWSVARNSFIPLDDPQYVLDNPRVRDGFAPGSIAWAWTAGYEANWHPLTWMSHMLDCELFGLNAGAHHLVALALHALSTVLLATLLFRWTRDFASSLFVAAVFGVHPLHVESVAWVAERKDVLSHVFFVLTLHAWTSWCERGGAARYALALVLFALGLTAKPMLVTLPPLLLVLDFWPLSRVASKGWRALVVEKLPFFALAAASCVVTFLVQRAWGAVVEQERLSLGARVANTFVAYARYAIKLVWPADFSVMYPPRDWSALQVGASALLLVAALVWAWIGRKERPWRLAGLAWYLGTLVPVIGLVQVGYQSLANRYTYVPLTGLVLALVVELAHIGRRLRATRALAALAVLATLACAWRTTVELARWRDGVTLFSRAVEIDPQNHVARRLLSKALAYAGRAEEAQAELEKAAAVPRAQTDALVRLAHAAGARDDWSEAAKLLTQATRLTPRHAGAHFELALALLRLEQKPQARAEFERAIELEPANAQARGQLGRLLLEGGELDAALVHFRAAHEAMPNEPRVAGTLALALIEADRAEEAFATFGALLRSAPDPTNAALARAAARARARGDEARAKVLEKLALDVAPGR